MENDIFISYSRKDTKIVDQFVNRLIEGGYRVWIDRKGINSGDQFKAKIVKAIKQSSIVIFFSSASSNTSDWTIKEISYSLKKGKTIIPVKLDNSEYGDIIEFDLVNIDFIKYNAKQLSLTIERLLSSITFHLDKHTPPINSSLSSKTLSDRSKPQIINSEPPKAVSSSRKNSKSNKRNKPKSSGFVENDNKTRFDVVLKSVSPYKLQVLKRIKEYLSIGLKDAKDIVDNAPITLMECADRYDAETFKKELEKRGATIELKPTVNIASKDTFKLVLIDSGTQKLQLIKIIKDLFSLGLKDAKDLVDNAPITLTECANRYDAETFKKELEKRGATIEIKQTVNFVSKDTFKLVLIDSGPQKLQLIKMIKDLFSLGLKDAKDLVDKSDTAPVILKESTSRTEVRVLKELFERIFAVTEVVHGNGAQNNDSFDIILLDIGPDHASLASTIMKLFNLRLQNTIGIVNDTCNLPITLKMGVSKLEALFLKKKLEKVGAKVSIK